MVATTQRSDECCLVPQTRQHSHECYIVPQTRQRSHRRCVRSILRAGDQNMISMELQVDSRRPRGQVQAEPFSYFREFPLSYSHCLTGGQSAILCHFVVLRLTCAHRYYRIVLVPVQAFYGAILNLKNFLYLTQFISWINIDFLQSCVDLK